ncbi:MAG: hypothetical protein KAJ25_15095, partial [Desulfobacula sp.]|nr:hypothetical protein [Desulfobacula sp.]
PGTNPVGQLRENVIMIKSHLIQAQFFFDFLNTFSVQFIVFSVFLNLFYIICHHLLRSFR